MRSRMFISLISVFLLNAVLGLAQPSWFQGFETDNSGWDVFVGLQATRVPSGANGVTSRAGAFHAEVSQTGAATNWGGYSGNAGCAATACAAGAFPSNGYFTSVDVYLNVAGGWANDTRFDFISAINLPNGAHRRDFAFNAGFYNDSDSTGSGPRFVISASPNAGRGSAYPKNPGRGPIAIYNSGWYTFIHRFNNVGGVLSVDLLILDASTNQVNKWTLSDPSDIIGSTVGGNRYGWFINEFRFLAIDNAARAPLPLALSKVPNVYQVSYAANLNVGDSYVNVTNTGAVEGRDPAGRLCVNVYVFDPNEEPVSCCTCPVTPNGLKSLSVRNDLIANPLTPGVPTSAVIKLVATAPVDGACNASGITAETLARGMGAWRTTLHAGANSPPDWQTTEVPFTVSELSTTELAKLKAVCGFIQTYASGFGICRSCQSGAMGGQKQQ